LFSKVARLSYVVNEIFLVTFENKTLSVSTSEAVGPGTYDAALRCATQLNNANGRVFYASMTVLAVRDAA
jgi:hypothetical protein